MTPQRITIRIDALSITGGPVSRAALERAIAGAVAGLARSVREGTGP
ncbi:hypothetical protein [Rhodovulum sp.]|nr:hypothetical protein [Rhodovulum sp.]